MAKPVVLTLNAREDLENISTWLAENWPIKVLEDFLDLYETKILLIS